MPIISNETLYTDQQPGTDDWDGKVLEEGDPDARFVLIGKGAVLSDADAKKFGVEKHGAFSAYNEADALAAREQSVIDASNAIADHPRVVQANAEPSNVGAKAPAKTNAKGK